METKNNEKSISNIQDGNKIKIVQLLLKIKNNIADI